MDDLNDEIEAIKNVAEEVSESSGNESSPKEWELLGLRAYKIPNITQQVFNIISVPLINKRTKAAEFVDNIKAQTVYQYKKNVENSDARCEEDKEDVNLWLQTMPPRPKGGFRKGDAEAHFGKDHIHVLERVLEKSKEVKRPEASSYADTKALDTDQKVLDSLPDQLVFTNIKNASNIGKKLYFVIFI